MELKVYTVRLDPPRWLRNLLAYVALPVGVIVGAAAIVRAGIAVTLFTSGKPIRAQEVNDNFANLRAAIEGAQTDVESIKTSVAGINASLSALDSARITVTPWTAFVPSATAGKPSVSTTPLTVSAHPGLGFTGSPGYWRRVGDSVEVMLDMDLTSCGNGAGPIFVGLPTGLVADTAKLPSLYPVVGEALGYNWEKSTSNTFYAVLFDVAEKLLFMGNGGAAPSCSTFGGGALSAIKMHFAVPIKGWSVSN